MPVSRPRLCHWHCSVHLSSLWQWGAQRCRSGTRVGKLPGQQPAVQAGNTFHRPESGVSHGFRRFGSSFNRAQLIKYIIGKSIFHSNVSRMIDCCDIRRGDAIGGRFLIDRFVEKPDANTAADRLARGEYHWNICMSLLDAEISIGIPDRIRRRSPPPHNDPSSRPGPGLDSARLGASSFASSWRYEGVTWGEGADPL